MDNDDITLVDAARARLSQLRFLGDLTEDDAQAIGGTLVTTMHGLDTSSDHVTLSLIVDDNQFIHQARYRTWRLGWSCWCSTKPSS